MCLSRHPVQCSSQTNGVALQKTKKFLGVTFSSAGRRDKYLDTCIGKASAVMHQLYQLPYFLDHKVHRIIRHSINKRLLMLLFSYIRCTRL